MSGEPDKYGPEWAKSKLNMPRRKRELERHTSKWLPELRTMEPGNVLDVGCGPCDWLALCQEMGHTGFGVDNFTGNSPMGRAYTSLCRKHCTKFMVPVFETGLHSLTLNDHFSVIHCRGAIEQIGERTMSGPPHVEHHDCRKLDWTEHSGGFLGEFIGTCSRLLKPGGLLLIVANGTKSTDEYYDTTVRKAADTVGLELVASEGLLTHKWRKR